MPYALAQYLDATDDASLLKEQEPYLARPRAADTKRDRGFVPKGFPETGSIYEHACAPSTGRCRRWASTACRSWTSDWNDGMGDVGVGARARACGSPSSSTTSYALRADRREAGRPSALRLYRERAAQLKAAVRRSTPGTGWWLRAFYDDGEPLGSVANEQWMIDSSRRPGP